jgi:hypothetical protein
MEEGIAKVNEVYRTILEGECKATSSGGRSGKAGAKMSTASVKASKDNWDAICARLLTGGPGQREKIEEAAASLRDVVLELDMSLATGYRGFERSEEGCTFLPELAFAGEERCFLRRKRSQEEVKPGTGNGAYRVTINTDVSWGGDPTRNAAVMGALVMLLQNFGPVEIWIQQGWVSVESRYGDGCDGGVLAEHELYKSGVTLFKLECDGRFEPSHLAFWVGDPEKDHGFSSSINKTGLRRKHSCTYSDCLQPTDIYLAGTWSDDLPSFYAMTEEEKNAAAAGWIQKTVRKTVFVLEDGA